MVFVKENGANFVRFKKEDGSLSKDDLHFYYRQLFYYDGFSFSDKTVGTLSRTIESLNEGDTASVQNIIEEAKEKEIFGGKLKLGDLLGKKITLKDGKYAFVE